MSASPACQGTLLVRSDPDGYGRVRVRSWLDQLGRPESCEARQGRAGSEVRRIRVRVKRRCIESVSEMSRE